MSKNPRNAADVKAHLEAIMGRKIDATVLPVNSFIGSAPPLEQQEVPTFRRALFPLGAWLAT